ncbi:MAG: hypothetical protein WCS42_27570, partial [Verrucomicrobiota bacterium]
SLSPFLFTSNAVTYPLTALANLVSSNIKVYGGGNHAPGQTIALATYPTGTATNLVFLSWLVNSGGPLIASLTNDVTTLTMPAGSANITANFTARTNILDDANATGITITGGWTASTFTPGYYGVDYLQDGNAGGGKSVTFTPTIGTAGYYDVYVWWVDGSNRASNARIDVNYALGTATNYVNQQIGGSAWHYLGRYQFNAGTSGNVTVRDDGANGFVIADAVAFAPAAAAPPVLTINRAGSLATISWTNGGTLQSADQVQGPYTTVTNATNPFFILPVGTKFFRVLQ